MHGQLKRRLRRAVPPLRILRSNGKICRERRVKNKQGVATPTWIKGDGKCVGGDTGG